MSRMLTEKRIPLGLRFLDETRPDWRSAVDVDQLVMSRMESCVLGQVFGRYDDGAELLYEWWVDQGFLDDPSFRGTPDEECGFEIVNYEDYSDLTLAWQHVIANEPECDGCDQDPWRAPVHYGTCPLNTTTKENA